MMLQCCGQAISASSDSPGPLALLGGHLPAEQINCKAPRRVEIRLVHNINKTHDSLWNLPENGTESKSLKRLQNRLEK